MFSASTIVRYSEGRDSRPSSSAHLPLLAPPLQLLPHPPAAGESPSLPVTALSDPSKRRPPLPLVPMTEGQISAAEN
jgi:hypothetical protein